MNKPTPKLYKSFEPDLIDIAYRAGDFIKLQLTKLDEIAVEIKDDDTPVTIVDKRVNAFVIDLLTQRFLKGDSFSSLPIRLVGEENVDEALSSSQKDLGSDFVIYVDPIDGTKSFIHHREKGEWCVLLSVSYQGLPVAGVCYIPLHDECYFASSGNGAFKIPKRHADPISISCSPLPLSSSVLLRSSTRTNSFDDTFTKHFKFSSVKLVSSFGIKACYIAEGRLSSTCYLNACCSYWDSCGVQCILEEAGGVIVDLGTLKSKTYCGQSTLNPNMLLVASSSVA
eukprot:CAMPEP_0117423650 /NCGR_PEP_ID=MMETSP0758-20121206/4221_1 /TAXON_ID=63605 /ORGANISM="Percolomonas cosmopolitus, Strain AE-1 (ATCC 50343)" /LENGTH=282 /DNA_ID=CAMNT_0005206945 /DNA_START=9 /DNA_END=854 /DNA_ORIENTATION=+